MGKIAEIAGVECLFEDEYLFIINKQACIHSVISPRSNSLSVAGLLVNACPELAQASAKPGDGGLINRLDFFTSGALIGAKNREIWECLRAALGSGQVNKSYLALLDGELSQKTEVQSYLGSPYRRGQKVHVYEKKPSAGVRALPARTVYRPLRVLPEPGLTLAGVEASPARRHQVRAHAAYIGRPLAGDHLYGSQTDLKAKMTASVAGRIGAGQLPDFFLHADTVSFRHPVTGVIVSVKVEVPQGVSSILEY